MDYLRTHRSSSIGRYDIRTLSLAASLGLPNQIYGFLSRLHPKR